MCETFRHFSSGENFLSPPKIGHGKTAQGREGEVGPTNRLVRYVRRQFLLSPHNSSRSTTKFSGGGETKISPKLSGKARRKLCAERGGGEGRQEKDIRRPEIVGEESHNSSANFLRRGGGGIERRKGRVS